MLTIMIGLNVEYCRCNNCVRRIECRHDVVPLRTDSIGANHGWLNLEGSSGCKNSLPHSKCHTPHHAGLG